MLLPKQTTTLPILPSFGAIPTNDISFRSHPVTIYLDGLAVGPSRDVSYRRLVMGVRLISEEKEVSPLTFRWNHISYISLACLKDKLRARMCYKSANAHLTAMKCVLRIAYELGEISPQHWASLQLVKPIKGSRMMAGRGLAMDELETLFDGVGKGFLGMRRRVLLVFLYGCGMRITEAVTRKYSDLVMENHTLFCRVVGKGNKERRVPIPSSVQMLVMSYAEQLHQRNQQDGIETTWLFPGTKTHIYAESARQELRRIAKKLHIDHFTPHDMRRTYISNLFDVGVDVAIIAKLVGHANIQQTVMYDRRPECAQVVAVERLPVWGKSEKP